MVGKVSVLPILPDYLYLYNMDYCVTAPHGFLTSIMNRCRLYYLMPDTMCGSQTAEEILTLRLICLLNQMKTPSGPGGMNKTINWINSEVVFSMDGQLYVIHGNKF